MTADSEAGHPRHQQAPTSTACPNCGSTKTDEYCAACGQRQGDLLPSLKTWAAEALDEIVLVEARLPRTLGTLLWPPGALTMEWWEGRRAAYVSPLRLYLLAALPFFLVFTSAILSDGQEGLLEVVASIPAQTADSTEYLPPQGPLPFELVDNPTAREAWQAEFARIQEHNRAVDSARRSSYGQAVSRVFELLPVAVGLVMVPLLALFMLPSVEGGLIASLVLSLHLHTVTYGLAIVGALVGHALLVGLLGGGAYLVGVRTRLFGDRVLPAALRSALTVGFYFLSAFFVFVCTAFAIQALS